MHSTVIIECACVLLFLAVIVKIDSQNRFRTEFFVPEEDDYLPSITQGRKGPNECICMAIRRCNNLRNRTDWRTAGETCFGYGDYRGVCCPDTIYNDGECGDSRLASNPYSLTGKGGNASEGSWPWMVSIGSHRCSGFLIDRRHVISAAHCYDIGNSESITVRIGNVNQEEADEYRITRFLVHPDYNRGQFYNDIAILTLDREVKSPSFNPVCLPDEEVGRMDLDGRALTVVGWGFTSVGMIPINLKYWTGLKVLPNPQCQEIFSRNIGDFSRRFSRGISKDMLCAELGKRDHDICPTSGSPLMVQQGDQWLAIGMMSFGLGVSCGRPGIPEGYANIINYLDWIRENTKD